MSDNWVFDALGEQEPNSTQQGAAAPSSGTDLDSIYSSVGQKYGLDPKFLKAWATQESAENPKNVNPTTGAAGLMGWLPQEAKKAGFNPYDPAAAVDASAARLKSTLASNGNNLNGALMQYYGGPNQRQWGPNTQAYPGQVLSRYSGSNPLSYQASATAPQPSTWQAMLEEEDKANNPVIKGSPGDFSAAAIKADPSLQEFTGPRQTVQGNWDWGQEAASAATLGYGPELEAAGGAVRNGVPYNATLEAQNAARDVYRRQNPWSAAGADVVGSLPQLPALLAGGAAIDSLPATKALSGLLGNYGPAVTSTIRNAALGAAQGAATSHENPNQSIGGQAATGAAYNAVLPAVLNPLIGNNISPDVARVAQGLISNGEDIPTAQIPGVPGVVKGLNTIFGPKNTGGATRQIVGQQITDAVNQFGNVAVDARPTTPQGAQLASSLSQIEQSAAKAFSSEPDKIKDIMKLTSRIRSISAQNGGALTGQDYESFTAGDGPLMSVMQQGGRLGFYHGLIKDALDSAAQQQNPTAFQALRAARGDYGGTYGPQGNIVSDVIGYAQKHPVASTIGAAFGANELNVVPHAMQALHAITGADPFTQFVAGAAPFAAAGLGKASTLLVNTPAFRNALLSSAVKRAPGALGPSRFALPSTAAFNSMIGVGQ